jgi:two-component system, NtrC family, response regulator AlgB
MLSLRQRTNDILPLAEHLLRFFVRQNAKPITGFAPTVREAIVKYSWPGNIRELRNAIERGVILSPGPLIQAENLPSQIVNPPPADLQQTDSTSLDAIEADHIRQVLATAATLEEAANKLGINASTLYRKRKRYGI